MQQGEIWWASLSPPRGSGPGKRRPVLVVQSNSFNRSKIQTVVIVVMTSNLDLADAPGNVLIRRKQSGLPKSSVANVSQVLTADRRQLTEYVGTLPARTYEKIAAGLRLVLDLS